MLKYLMRGVIGFFDKHGVYVGPVKYILIGGCCHGPWFRLRVVVLLEIF